MVKRFFLGKCVTKVRQNLAYFQKKSELSLSTAYSLKLLILDTES